MKANTQDIVTVSIESGKAIAGAVKTTEGGSKKWLVASDLLFKDGVRAPMLAGQAKVADIADAVRANIALGFTESERKLLASDTKALSEAKKAEKSKAQKKFGPYIRLIQKYLTEQAIKAGEIEDPAESEESEDKTVADKLKIMLESCQKLVQGDEDPKGYDPVIMAKLIGQAIAIIK